MKAGEWIDEMELCCLWIGGVMGGGTANGSAKKSKQQQQLHEINERQAQQTKQSINEREQKK